MVGECDRREAQLLAVLDALRPGVTGQRPEMKAETDTAAASSRRQAATWALRWIGRGRSTWKPWT